MKKEAIYLTLKKFILLLSPYHYNNRLLVKDTLLPFIYKNKPSCK